jgi:hypothetical protein
MKSDKQTSVHKGLSSNRSKFPDSSTGLKGQSVDTGATRKGTAPTPKSLGPRSTGSSSKS